MPDSVMMQCGNSVVTTIQALSLSTLDTATEVMLRKVYADGAQVFRGVSVIPVPEREAPGTNVRDDYGYGFLIVCAKGSGHGSREDIDVVSLWRQQIKKAFNNKRLSGVTEVYICTFEPGEPFMKKEYLENRDISAMVIRCWARESRT